MYVRRSQILYALFLALTLAPTAQGESLDSLFRRVFFPFSTVLSPGSQAPSFNKVSLGLPGSDSAIRDLLIDEEGRVVVTGRRFNGRDDDFLVARFLPDGSLDTHFGSDGGYESLQFGNGFEIAHAMAFQKDGSIVLAGRSDPTGNSFFDFAVTKLRPNGEMDRNFGQGGFLLETLGAEYPGSTDIARAVAVDRQDRILVAGYSRYPHHTEPFRFAMMRLLSNGELDTSFGSEGKVVTATSTEDNGAVAMTLLPSGKIVLAGTYSEGAIAHISVAQYKKDGQLDPKFGTGGIVNYRMGNLTDGVATVAHDLKGRIIVGGSLQVENGFRQGTLSRLNRDGTLDSSFGNGGKVYLPSAVGDIALNRIVVDSAGGILAAGSICRGVCERGSSHFLIARFLSNGVLDSTFANGGLLGLSFYAEQDVAQSIACTINGICVAGGRTKHGTGFELALARIDVSSRPQQSRR